MSSPYLDFLARELAEQVELPIKVRNSFNVFQTETLPSYADEGSFYIYSASGIAKVVKDYSTDFPDIEIDGERVVYPLEDIGASYHYTQDVIDKAIAGGFNLGNEKFINTREAILNKMESVAWNGYPEQNVAGILNHPNITIATITTGVSTSTYWNQKTYEEILKDINIMQEAIRTASVDRETPNTLFLPTKVYSGLNKSVISGTSETFLQALSSSLAVEGVVNIIPIPELRSAGVGGVGRMILGTDDPMAIAHKIAQPPAPLAPQQQGYKFTVYMKAKYAGLKVKRPIAFVYMDGVSDGN